MGKTEAEPAAKAASCRHGENFIPLRKAELIRVLAEDSLLCGEERTQFLQLCHLLEATLHYEYHKRLEQLKELYAPFNPDAVTQEARPLTDAQRSDRLSRLFEEFSELLERANYSRLSPQDIEAALTTTSWGVRLHVDFDAFERLELYARGQDVEQRSHRRWRNYFRSEETDVTLYQRLVVIFRLSDENVLDRNISTSYAYLKVFKNIPTQDVDTLLPAASFQMTLLDRGKIILPTLSGIVMAVVKIFQGALLLAFTGVYGILALLGFVGATMGYGVKSFLGYLRTKEKYQLNLTRNLYYQNLDNNAGVLFRLLDEAEEQEFCEAILAYAMLRRRGDRDGWSANRLDIEAEAYLSALVPDPVDFEVHDALDKLARLGCATRTSAETWQAASLGDALAGLDQQWDSYFHHQPPSDPSV